MDVLFPPRALVAFLLVALLSLCPARAQDSTAPDSTTAVSDAEPLLRITLADGSDLIGRVERETETALQFRTASGVRIDVPKDRIRARAVLEGRLVDGVYRRLDPNRTRLLFAPTARPLGSGEGYVSVYQVFVPFAAVGVGEHVSLAGGVSLLPFSSTQLIYAAPKISFARSRQTSFALGAFVGTTIGEATGEGFGGIVYGLGTFGESDAAVTAGGGVAFGDGEVFTEQPVFIAGGEYQLSGSVKLLSENYVFVGDGTTTVLSGGIRLFGDNLAASLGLFTSPEVIDDGGGFPFLPFVSFAYNFNQ